MKKRNVCLLLLVFTFLIINFKDTASNKSLSNTNVLDLSGLKDTERRIAEGLDIKTRLSGGDSNATKLATSTLKETAANLLKVSMIYISFLLNFNNR